MPATVVFWIVPVVTVTLPAPVVASAMPPPAPSAHRREAQPTRADGRALHVQRLALVVVRVLLLLVAFTVPPPVGVEGRIRAVLAVIAPVKVIVAPVLVAS